MMRYQELIWDFDGTLFDTYPAMCRDLGQVMGNAWRSGASGRPAVPVHPLAGAGADMVRGTGGEDGRKRSTGLTAELGRRARTAGSASVSVCRRNAVPLSGGRGTGFSYLPTAANR